VELREFLLVFVVGFVVCWLHERFVEKAAYNLYQKERGAKGVQVKQEYADERAAALAEAVAIYQGEGTNEEKLKKGAALLVKYPSSAAWLVKQFRAFKKMASRA